MSAADARAGQGAPRECFVTGATGHLGRSLVPALLERGWRVRALVRGRPRAELPGACEQVEGDPLDGARYACAVPRGATLVHLVGTPHPAPWKAAAFRALDGPSLEAALVAARGAAARQIVYVSVAQPAPILRAYVRVRAACEASVRASGLAATILRPWYVLGPGRRWPLAFLPLYALAERLPATAEGARRLGLLWLEEILGALVWSIEQPPAGVRVLDVPELRRLGRAAPRAGVD